jgi:DNA-binding NarL/FixJ family response regulator
LVATLPERDVAPLLRLVSELETLDDPLPFPASLLARLADLIPATVVAYNELDRVNERALFASWFAEGEQGMVADDETYAAGYFRLRHQHPACSRRDRTGDFTSPWKVSDFATLREVRRTEIWNELYRDTGVNYWIDVGLPPQRGCTSVFIFMRGKHDFDERDRALLRLLQPHLETRKGRTTAAAVAADALAEAAATTSDDAAAYVVLCSRRGVIEFASPKTRRLLERYFGPVNGRLPEPVIRTLPRTSQSVSVERDGRRLSVRSARVGSLVVLLIAERDVRLDRLTARQRQILRHVARGETNDEIAYALSISPATVGKHLEMLYTRLGVSTRTAAAAALLAPGSAE